MQESGRKFAISSFIIMLVLMAVGFGAFNYLIPDLYFPFFPAVPFFLFTITVIFHVYLLKASANDPGKFASRYLGAMGIKLLIYLIFIVIFLALSRTHAIPFLLSFLVSYTTFTFFEVRAILQHQKRT